MNTLLRVFAAVAGLVLATGCDFGVEGGEPPGAVSRSLAGAEPQPAAGPASVTPGAQVAIPEPAATDEGLPESGVPAVQDRSAVGCIDVSTGFPRFVACVPVNPIDPDDTSHGDPEPWRPGHPIPQPW
jgi:hypothetical protein